MLIKVHTQNDGENVPNGGLWGQWFNKLVTLSILCKPHTFMFHLDWTWGSCQKQLSNVKRQSCITSLITTSSFSVSCVLPPGQMPSNILYIPGQWLKKIKSLSNCSLPFKRNISAKKKMWKCRHSSENSILHSTEPLWSFLNDPFYHGAMSVPFWIVRPVRKIDVCIQVVE